MFARVFVLSISLAGCRAFRSVPPPSDCPEPYDLAASRSTPRLPLPALPAIGKASLIGVAVDSTSRRGVKAVVSFVSLGDNTRDTMNTRTDSTGAFAALIAPGRYRLSARALNFHVIQDTIFVRQGIDTLRLSFQRGLPLCNVRF